MVSTRSSPLSSASPSPPPGVAAPSLGMGLPHQTIANPPRPPSSSSSLSNDEPPSSLPDAPLDPIEDDGDDSDATSDTVPLPNGSYDSDSDLTEEESDGELGGGEASGSPVGVIVEVKAGSRNGFGSPSAADLAMSGASTPRQSQTATPTTQTRQNGAVGSTAEQPQARLRSSSLTPPPNPLPAANHRSPNSSPNSSASHGAKRTRDGKLVSEVPVPNGSGVAQVHLSEISTTNPRSMSPKRTNGHVNADLAQSPGGVKRNEEISGDEAGVPSGAIGSIGVHLARPTSNTNGKAPLTFVDQFRAPAEVDRRVSGSPTIPESSLGIDRTRNGESDTSAPGAISAGSSRDAQVPNGDDEQQEDTVKQESGPFPTIRRSFSKAEMEDMPLPENTDDPDAQMAFLDALDAFDAEDLRRLGGGEEDVDMVQEAEGDAEPEGPREEDAVMEDAEMTGNAEPAAGATEGDRLVPNGGDANEEGVKKSTALPEDVVELEEADRAPGAIAGETAIAVGKGVEDAAIGINIDEIVMPQQDPDVPQPTKDTDPTPSPGPSAAPVSNSTLPAPTHTHSSHAPPPSQAAMRALLTLELKFAALRDRLYIERMEEAAEEEEMVLNGTHPALQQLYKTLSHRRERLHELASRRHAQAMEELKVVRKGEQNAVWSWWTDERDRMHWGEFEQTWSKRRRLAREKNEIESVRWTRPVPVVGDPRFSKGFDWSVGPTPTRLSGDEGSHDLALMEHRQIQLSRHASPATFPPLPNFPMNHHQHSSHHPQHAQQLQQQQSNQYASYVGPTYAEAAGTTSGSAAGYSESPRVISGGNPRSRLGTPGGGGPNNIGRNTQPSQPQSLGGPGLMDHLAYPRNATALGPTSSGSSISFFQPLPQSQSQQQRREGRTVPTASTMFGPNSTHSNTNSPVSQSFPFNQTPAQSLPTNPNTISSTNPNGTQSTNASLPQNGISKEVKQEMMDHGAWGMRSHVPMGFGLGFGMGGGGSGGSTAGFGTLGSTATPPSLDQPPSYTAVFAAGAGTGAGVPGVSEGIEKAIQVATPTSRPPTPNGNAAPVSFAGGGAFWHRAAGLSKVNLNGEKSAEGTEENTSLNGDASVSDMKWRSNGNTSQQPDLGSAERREEMDDFEKERQRQIDVLRQRDKEIREDTVKEKEKERERERERDKPKYPGLADYLGASSAASFGGGLSRMAVRAGTGGPLSTPGVGVSRSPFSAQPPAVIPNAQTRT